MSLSHDIISEFVKVTNTNKEKPKEGIVYATIVQGSDGKYVKIDGSDLLTPADTTTDIEDGERVTVMIKDHKATVTGNVTAPSASGNRVGKVVETVTEQIGVFETVVADKVSTNELEAYKITVDTLIAGKAEIEDLEATNAVIENLKVKDAEIENLVADKATIEDLEAVNATIENLKVKDAEIENAVIGNLEATKAEIGILEADFAQIKTLVSGNLTSDNILSFNITADKVTMEDAFIKDAMIDTVSAAKINAGKINTNSVTIGSEDGGMLIAGATQQFTDKNGNVRIQIGRDASDDFTFALYGEDGQGQLINQNGITASAISDGIIVNDMISDDASISGGKLDISSVVTEINNDNTTTIKSNKIYLDEQNQSLEVAFKSLKTQVDTIKDIDSDLTTITDKIQSNTSKIEANKSSISTLLAEDAVIKKQVTDLEGNVVETTNTLTSKYTSLQQNLDGFKTTVNNTYATKTSVNDVKNNLSTNYSTTSAMNSAINQKVDEITASVSSTYATKNEVQSIDDNIKSNYSTTEQMESAISVAKDEINLGISKVYETKEEVTNKVTTAVNNIQVGGRNYFLNSSYFSMNSNNTGTGSSVQKTDEVDVYYRATPNTDKAVSLYKTITKSSSFKPNGIDKYIISLMVRSPKDTTIKIYDDVDYSNAKTTSIKANVWTQITTLPYVMTSSRNLILVSNAIGSYLDYKMAKLENGTCSTTWTPAPEDIDTSITNAETNAVTTSKNYADSQIKIAKESIELGVSKTYETKTSVTSQVSTALTSAKSYADTKKSEAISTASSDATSKANNALTSAKSYTDTAKNALNTEIGKKANSADVYTKSQTYTKSETDSAIKISKDAIELGISEKYETKENVTTKITNAVDNIQIGNTNLMKNSKTFSSGYSKYSGTLTPNGYNGFTVFYNKFTGGSSYEDFQYNSAIVPEPNTTYTLSFWAKGKGTISNYFYPDTVKNGINSQGRTTTSVDGHLGLVLTETWTRYWITWTTLNTVSGVKSIILSRQMGSSDSEVYLCGVKFERGNKCSDWSPAPEDVDTSITTAETNAVTTSKNYADSQINVAKNAITQSVSSTYATKTDVTSSINGVNSSISNLQNRMSSAESKITDSSITNTVKQNFYTKTETDGKVTTVQNNMQSSITQLSNQIATKVDVNGVLSTIQQNPNSIQIGFNKISNALTIDSTGMIAKAQNGNKYYQLGYDGITMYNPANGTHEWGRISAINSKFTVASNGNSTGLSLGHFVSGSYAEDILCSSAGVVHIQRQMNHNGILYNNYGHIIVRQSGQGGWEITGRSDSQAIKPGGANQGAIGSSTQYINQSWIANRYNPSSLKLKHLSHYIDDLECLKLINDVKPARYFYKEYNENGDDVTTFTSRTSQLGLIYEDVRACSGRDLITNEEDAAINLYGMVSVLWGAVRNLNNRLNDVEYENVTLKNELEEVKNMLNKS